MNYAWIMRELCVNYAWTRVSIHIVFTLVWQIEKMNESVHIFWHLSTLQLWELTLLWPALVFDKGLRWLSSVAERNFSPLEPDVVLPDCLVQYGWYTVSIHVYPAYTLAVLNCLFCHHLVITGVNIQIVMVFNEFIFTLRLSKNLMSLFLSSFLLSSFTGWFIFNSHSMNIDKESDSLVIRLTTVRVCCMVLKNWFTSI